MEVQILNLCLLRVLHIRGVCNAPVVKHARRGNYSAAVEALLVNGTGAVVQYLICDRHARSSVPPACHFQCMCLLPLLSILQWG